MNAKTNERCAKCQYQYGTDQGEVICGYIVFTGKMRKCPAYKCNKFKNKTKRRMVGMDEVVHWKEDT